VTLTGIALALVSALCFGLSDFAAGLAARHLHSTVVVFIGQLCGVLLTLAFALFIDAPAITGADLVWGALSGIGTGLGAAFLFQAMSVGRFSVVVPLSDVAGVAIPVLIGVALLHDHLTVAAWCGFAVAVPALWLMTSGDGPVVDRLQALGGLCYPEPPSPCSTSLWRGWTKQPDSGRWC
jgi:uncharacterized membrane protein